jgi:hypothetical protein
VDCIHLAQDRVQWRSLANDVTKDDLRKYAQAGTLLVCIWEEPGSKFGLDTDYADRGFCGFPQSLDSNSSIVP